MALIDKEIFVKLALAPAPQAIPNEPMWRQPMSLLHQVRNATYNRAGNRPVVDRASALQVLDEIRAYLGDNGYLAGKYLRPWDVDKDLYGRLDRREPWWGFEFETGWTNVDTRKAAIYHTWDTWDNVVFDSEGEGSAVEITFAPEEMSKYLDGTAQAYKFAEFLTGNPNTHRGAHDSVGTHINISDPNLTNENVAEVAYKLNRTVAHLPLRNGDVDVRKLFFGRSSLYGGFFVGDGNATWIEGKLFRTTYNMDEFKRYITTCEALTKCMAALIADNRPNCFVSNLYEMVTDGADPVIMDDVNRGPLDGGRGNGYINGGFARDVFDLSNKDVDESDFDEYDDPDEDEYYDGEDEEDY